MIISRIIYSIFKFSLILYHVSSSSEGESFKWHTGGWTKCVRQGNCGLGEQQRFVSCVDFVNNTFVNSTYCDIKVKPASIRVCFKNCNKPKTSFKWSADTWSDCESRKKCSSNGMATRSVQCLIHKNSDSLEISANVSDDQCELPKPLDNMMCSSNCPWYCNQPGNSSKTERYLGFMKISKPISRNWNQTFDNDVSSSVCSNCSFPGSHNINEFVIKVGQWSDCIPLHTFDARISTFAANPIRGFRMKNYTCLNSNGVSVSTSHCNNITIPIVENCIVPMDCQLSPWSPWHVTVEGCRDYQLLVPEERVRSRYLVRLPIGMGKPCGPLSEKRIFTHHLFSCIRRYNWHLFPYGSCIVHSAGVVACGGGTQFRNVSCRHIHDGVSVGDEYCYKPRPTMVRKCRIPCLQDCRVSPWSEWSDCMPNETPTVGDQRQHEGHMIRSRVVTEAPSGGGLECPHLQELSDCENVRSYVWSYGNWSKCQLLNNSRCGQGEIRRPAFCFSADGRSVADFYCFYNLDFKDDFRECYIHCISDPVWSEWSEWSLCSRACSSDQHGAWKRRYRQVLAVGHKDIDIHDTIDEEACNWYRCDPFLWSSGPWTNCTFQNGQDDCGEGIQKRAVSCMKGELQYSNLNCRHLKKPAEWKFCFVPCSVDCVFSFSEWTACPFVYNPVQIYQERQLIIDVAAEHGGSPCPEERREMKPCPMFMLDSKESYSWSLGLWSKCILVDDSNSCGDGFQMRDISCISAYGNPVEMVHCLNQNNLIVNSTSIPLVTRLCEVKCHAQWNVSCVLSDWSAWSACLFQQDVLRRRSRELIASYPDAYSCLKFYNLTSVEDCLFPKLHESAVELEWSSCILEDSSSVCGRGVRFQNGRIQHHDYVPYGIVKERCIVECPEDCKMSEWSSWTNCSSKGSCGIGIQRRQRRVLSSGSSLGRPCSSVTNEIEIEKKTCGIPCSEFKWLPSKWSKCKILTSGKKQENCGNGAQTRKLECIRKFPAEEEEVVKNWCYQLPVLPTKRKCTIFCADECVVSNWEIEKECDEPCDIRNSFIMRRHILRPGSNCPHLTRNEPCIFNSNCFMYRLELTEWSSCILPAGALCGIGSKQRGLQCRRSDNQLETENHCRKKKPMLYHNAPSNISCSVECPVDCILSTWSQWYDQFCRQSCLKGEIYRNRTILQLPTSTGRPCSKELSQVKPCPPVGCYHWVVGDWSPCTVSEKGCGYGFRHRSVKCVSSDGIQEVELINCIQTNFSGNYQDFLDQNWFLQLHGKTAEEQCYVPCPHDEIVHTWTTWTDCSTMCKTNFSDHCRKLWFPFRPIIHVLTQNTKSESHAMPLSPSLLSVMFVFFYILFFIFQVCVKGTL